MVQCIIPCNGLMVYPAWIHYSYPLFPGPQSLTWIKLLLKLSRQIWVLLCLAWDSYTLLLFMPNILWTQVVLLPCIAEDSNDLKTLYIESHRGGSVPFWVRLFLGGLMEFFPATVASDLLFRNLQLYFCKPDTESHNTESAVNRTYIPMHPHSTSSWGWWIKSIKKITEYLYSNYPCNVSELYLYNKLSSGQVNWFQMQGKG